MTGSTTRTTTAAGGRAQPDWLAVARELGPGFAARAAAHDADDTFVQDNYAELAQQRVFSAGVPGELGGGGASHRLLCAMLRELGRACGSTALGLSMHTHLLAMAVWRYQQGQPVAPLLRRVAAEQLVLVSTGASDWLDSSGTAQAVAGGYRVTARKVFASGSPAGDLLMTTARYHDPREGVRVLHFPLPMATPGVTVSSTWQALGMRGSGSNDVLVEDVFVPEGAVWLRRPAGQWHPFFTVSLTIAMPLVLSVYLGVAEAAYDLALHHLRQRKRDDPDVWYLVGALTNTLTTAQLAVQGTIDLCDDYAFVPELATVDAVLVRKTIAAQALLATVEKTLEAVGGSGLFRSLGLERLLRDVHGAQFHPMPATRQHRFSGRLALGLDPVG